MTTRCEDSVIHPLAARCFAWVQVWRAGAHSRPVSRRPMAVAAAVALAVAVAVAIAVVAAVAAPAAVAAAVAAAAAVAVASCGDGSGDHVHAVEGACMHMPVHQHGKCFFFLPKDRQLITALDGKHTRVCMHEWNAHIHAHTIAYTQSNSTHHMNTRIHTHTRTPCPPCKRSHLPPLRQLQRAGPLPPRRQERA